MDLSILKIGMLGFYSSIIFIGQSDITKSKGSHTFEGETTQKILSREYSLVLVA